MFSLHNASVIDIEVIQSIAEKTWWPTYSSIVSGEQLRYMLDTIYSAEALKKVMINQTQSFIMVSDERGPQGFASFGQRTDNPEVYKLHKLYVLPENQGKGYGRIMIDEIVRRVLRAGGKNLDLNVNRYNVKAKTFYEKLGFTTVGEEDVPIGPYWMNDYVMRLPLPMQ